MCTNKYRSTTLLEETLLDLHEPITRLAWTGYYNYIFSKKVIRNNTENSVVVGTFVPSLIHSFSFVYF